MNEREREYAYQYNAWICIIYTESEIRLLVFQFDVLYTDWYGWVNVCSYTSYKHDPYNQIININLLISFLFLNWWIMGIKKDPLDQTWSQTY